MRQKIAVLGAGRWGRTLAACLQKGGHDVRLWARGQDLRGTLLPVEGVVLAVPAQSVREVWAQLDQAPGFCWVASKGMEAATGLLLSEVIHEICPCPTGYFGGPHLAYEVMQAKPCGATLAAEDQNLIESGHSLFLKTPFILETTTDMMGAQALGVLKNIFSVAYGLFEQGDGGHNMLASFCIMALREMGSLVEALGGHKETLLTFAGLGDFLVSYRHGRNALYGRTFGTSQASTELAEGIASLKALHTRLKDQDFTRWPLASKLLEILEGRSPKDHWFTL